MPRTYTQTFDDTIVFAKELRKSGNPAEKLLWSKLRRKQFFGLQFRRQVPCGPYILDFLCIKRTLVIEIDGESHYEDGAHKKDRERDRYISNLGYTIIRIGHKETLQNIEGVLERIRMELRLEYR